MAEKILVLGGYGVFGGRLARRLVQETDAEIVVAGRSLEKARAHCSVHGGTPMALDRDGDLASVLAKLEPRIVIDAAGPFQAYGDDPYRVAKAAIAAGPHYLDLSDDSAFVTGIVALDAAAKGAGVCVVSGASSIPAISSAALDALTRGLVHVGAVGSAILPGNRAPRGLSVVRAILEQAGRPLRQWRGGAWTEMRAWSDLVEHELRIEGVKPVGRRWASSIGAPDLQLFPQRYGARCASFHAGLELKILHLGLWLLALPVRLGLVRSLAPLATALKWMADRLEPFGSDRGGMVAYALGRDGRGAAVERRWTLIAEAGDGPEIPPTPALLLAKRLLGWDRNEAGARPAVGVLTLEEVEAGLRAFNIRFGRTETPARPMLERALPDDFAALPGAWRRLADVYDADTFEGMASVERGRGPGARLVAKMFGFPPAAASVAVRVTKARTPAGEDWTRQFGDRRFISHLSRGPADPPGIVTERFGPFSFTIRLTVLEKAVHWPVTGWRALGVPMPKFLMPKSDAVEFVDAAGRFRFDVTLSVPVAGLIVRYRGWLRPIADQQSQGSSVAGSPACAPVSTQEPPPQIDQPPAVAPEAARTSLGSAGSSGL